MQDHSDAETERLPRNSSSESPTSEALGPHSDIGSPPPSLNLEGFHLPAAPETSQPAEPTFQNLPADSEADGVKLEVISDSPDPSTQGTASPPGSPSADPAPKLLPIQDPPCRSRSPSPAGKKSGLSRRRAGKAVASCDSSSCSSKTGPLSACTASQTSRFLLDGFPGPSGLLLPRKLLGW